MRFCVSTPPINKKIVYMGNPLYIHYISNLSLCGPYTFYKAGHCKSLWLRRHPKTHPGSRRLTLDPPCTGVIHLVPQLSRAHTDKFSNTKFSNRVAQSTTCTFLRCPKVVHFGVSRQKKIVTTKISNRRCRLHTNEWYWAFRKRYAINVL